MFQTKNFQSIVASAINRMRSSQSAITDFHIGSVVRTLIEAPAIELDEFYQRVLYGLLEAIPTAIYHAFNFDALPAAYAGGKVRFSTPTLVVSPVAIPIGTVVQRPDTRVRYLTTEAASIAAGANHVDVRVLAEYSGVNGNAPAGVITSLSGYLDQINAVVNLDPIVGGKEAESDEERKVRFLSYVGSLSRGTVWAINYAASSATVLGTGGDIAEYVTRIGIDEGAGRVDVYILGSAGEPTTELVTAAQSIIDGKSPTSTDFTWTPGYRSAGTEVTVKPMQITTVDIGMRVSFYSVESTIDSAFLLSVRNILDGALFAASPGDIVQANSLVDAVLGLPDVHQVIYDTSTNVRCELYEALRLGYLNLTPLV